MMAVNRSIEPAGERMRLSIAMATYNGERFLPVQLQSFLDQTRLPDELVVTDDGSSDETIAILERFAKKAPFKVRVERNSSNLGHEANFGKVMELTTGDLILLSDQDDRWDPDNLETVERAFSEQPGVLLMVNDVRITDGDLQPTGRTLLGQLRSSGLIGLDDRGLLIGCGTSFRAALKPLILPMPKIEYGHDTWINEFTAFLGGKRIIERPLQCYRRHGSNVSFTVLDAPKRATPFMIMAPSRGQDLTRQWQRRVIALSEMHRRLLAFGPERFAELRTDRSWEKALTDLDAARQATIRRMRVFRRNWAGRKLLAAEMLARGDYRPFSGWRSFAQDLIR